MALNIWSLVPSVPLYSTRHCWCAEREPCSSTLQAQRHRTHLRTLFLTPNADLPLPPLFQPPEPSTNSPEASPSQPQPPKWVLPLWAQMEPILGGRSYLGLLSPPSPHSPAYLFREAAAAKQSPLAPGSHSITQDYLRDLSYGVLPKGALESPPSGPTSTQKRALSKRCAC